MTPRREKALYTLAGVEKLKMELKDLQAKCIVLRGSRDTWKETCEASEKQIDVRAIRALCDQVTSEKAHSERRIETLETQLRFGTVNRKEAREKFLRKSA